MCRKKITIVLLLSLSLAVLAEQSIEQKTDTVVASQLFQEKDDDSKNDTIREKDFLATTSNINLLPYLQADSIITKLISKGISIDKNRIIYSGILDSSDSHKYLLVISLDEKNQTVKKAFLLDVLSDSSGAKKDSLSKIEISEGIQSPTLRQDGRVYFMINCAAKSIGVYSVGLKLAFLKDTTTNPQILTGISLLSLGASLYGSYIYTKDMEMGYGRVEFMNYGGDLGVTYPTLLAFLLRNSGNFKYTDEIHGWGQMLLFPLGIFAGSKVNFTGNFEYGNASLMTIMSRFGMMYGFTIPYIFFPPSEDNEKYIRYSTSLSMALIPAGFYLGKVLVDKYGPFSSGRSVFITTSAIMGSLTGLLIPTLWEENHERIYPITTLLGHIGGTIFGFNYMKARPYTFGQGMFMVASAVVGTAFAEAFPLIARVENNKPYVIFGIIGGWGGLILGENLAKTLFEKSSRDNSKVEKYSVKLAGIYQLPILWAYSKSNKQDKNIEIRIPVMEVNF